MYKSPACDAMQQNHTMYTKLILLLLLVNNVFADGSITEHLQRSMDSLIFRLSNVSDSSCNLASLSLDLISLMRLVALDVHKDSESAQTQPSPSNVGLAPHYQASTLNLVTLGGRRYFFSNQAATFFAAMSFCKAYGMELASIETPEENKLIVDHFVSLNGFVAYISGHNIGRGAFAWANGNLLSFSNWDTNEPTNSDAERCMCLHNKKWHNSSCVSPAHTFICEQL